MSQSLERLHSAMSAIAQVTGMDCNDFVTLLRGHGFDIRGGESGIRIIELHLGELRDAMALRDFVEVTKTKLGRENVGTIAICGTAQGFRLEER